jgi:DnaJ homolog subfamily C member 8
MSEDDIDAILAREASEFTRDQEVERILATLPMDAYSILELQPGCNGQVIKQTYRKKSLLIHPDKSKNPQAPDAFDRLKKAEADLQDDKTREVLDQAFADARRMLIKDKKWTIDDERVKGEEFLKEWREKTKEVLIENELRRRKLLKIQMEEEGRAKRKLEEAAEERQLKKERERAWEDTRDERVANWRVYQKKVVKNKNKKKNGDVLG